MEAHDALGPQGGLIAELGPIYHAEIVTDVSGEIRVHFWNEELSEAVGIDNSSLRGFMISRNGNPNPETILLAPTTEGESRSLFLGQLPEDLRGSLVALVVPDVRIDGRRWHFDIEMDLPALEEVKSADPQLQTIEQSSTTAFHGEDE